jgi:outer membrane protein TolC
MRTWRILALSALPLLIAGVFAQDTLQSRRAIQLALANEHGIRIAKNEAAIAQAQATAGNAGLLPRFDASGRGQLQQPGFQA